MLKLNTNPPAFASRAIGIMEGMIALDFQRGPLAVTLTTADGAIIPGVVHTEAAATILENPQLFSVRCRVLVYPRTEQSKLKIIVVKIEEAGEVIAKESDLFLIQGFNLGSRNPKMSQIGIRPNKRSKHSFDKFWLSLNGHLNEDQRCVYDVRAVRRGTRLFIISSDPILPKRCKPSPRNSLKNSFPSRPVRKD